MKHYELTYLISPDLTEEELKIFQEKINSLIREEAGKPQGLKDPVKKRLAYPIKKRGEAYLTTLNLHLLPDKLQSLEKKLKEEPKILRYLILVKEEEKRVKVPRIIPKVKFPKEKKVELEKIDEKLEEILGRL